MKKHIPIIIFSSIIVLLIVAEYFLPKETDWTPTFSNSKKNPYGCYILYDVLTKRQDTIPVEVQSKSVYEFFSTQYTDSVKSSMVIINEEVTILDIDMGYILNYVYEGNTMFISGLLLPENLLDTLGVQLIFNPLFYMNNQDSMLLNFTNPMLKIEEGYNFTKSVYDFTFNYHDTIPVTVLGTLNGVPNFIKINYGDGQFLFHLAPYAFTNYYMVNNQLHPYAFKSLAYLPSQKIYWDEYFKPGKNFDDSPLRFVLRSKALKAAYILFWVVLMLYILFNGKRKQRIIPIIQPLQNTSVEFIQTIGRLYFKSQNHKDIAEKKYTYLLDFLRSKYLIKISGFSDINAVKIAEKTGADVITVSKVFHLAQVYLSYNQLNQEHLLEFNKCIKEFYNQCK